MDQWRTHVLFYLISQTIRFCISINFLCFSSFIFITGYFFKGLQSMAREIGRILQGMLLRLEPQPKLLVMPKSIFIVSKHNRMLIARITLIMITHRQSFLTMLWIWLLRCCSGGWVACRIPNQSLPTTELHFISIVWSVQEMDQRRTQVLIMSLSTYVLFFYISCYFSFCFGY